MRKVQWAQICVSTAFAPYREPEGRQLNTLLERYFTDEITERSFPTARRDKLTQSYKITPEYRTINTTTTMTTHE